MKDFILNNKKAILFSILFLLAGFLAGRWTLSYESIKYVKGETVRDTIYAERLVPYRVEIPSKPTLPVMPDTIRIPGQPVVIMMKVDTSQIIAEYIHSNSYKKTLFDDKNGKLTVDATVQYNKLKQLGYEFTPIQKVIAIQTTPALTPFVTTSYSTLGYFVGAGAGVFYHDIGISAKYLTNFKNKAYEVGINYKF